MTKINIISIFFPPEKGAAASRIFKMCKVLQAGGYDVEVITALPNYPTGAIFEKYKRKFRVKETYENINVRRYWLYPSNSKNIFLRTFSMVSFSCSIFLSLFYLVFNRKPEIVIINTPPLFTGVAGVILSKLISTKIILNISDIWPLSALELGAIKKGRLYNTLEKMERFMYNKADIYIGQSNEILTHLNRYQPSKKHFLYRNLDLPSKYIHEGAVYDAQNIKIIYAGLLGVAQGILNICKTIDFKEIGVELHIYGAGNEEKELIKYIEKHPDRNIYFHGLVPKSQIPQILKRFHATLIPLVNPIYGAFPSKIFMAIASGLPILFSGEGEGAEVINKYELGWVNPSNNLEALAENLHNLRNCGEKKYQELKSNCIAISTSEFNFDNQNKSFLEFLKVSANLSEYKQL